MASMPKTKRKPLPSQPSRCSVWLKSVSPRRLTLRKPARRQRAAASSRYAGRALVAGAAGRAVEQEQRLCVLARETMQGVVAPDAVVGQVHALLASALGAGDGAVGLQDGVLEECLGLLPPDEQAFFVDGLLKRGDVRGGEAAEEIAGGGGVGDALRAEASR